MADGNTIDDADDETREDPAEPVEDPDWPALTPATCAAGTPHAGCTWAPEPCDGCKAISAALHAEFTAAVARGDFDAKGYEPGDRQFRQASLF
jgi:hypothetical protein